MILIPRVQAFLEALFLPKSADRMSLFFSQNFDIKKSYQKFSKPFGDTDFSFRAKAQSIC